MRALLLEALCFLLSGCIDSATAQTRSRIRAREPVKQGTTSAAYVNTHSFNPDGTDEFIRVADSARIDGSLTNFSICLWQRETTMAVGDIFAIKNAASQRQWIYRINPLQALRTELCVNDDLTDGACDHSCVDSGNTLADDTASFNCAVYDGSQGTAADRITLYVNGVNNAESCSGTPPAAFQNGTQPMDIGSNGGAGDYGPGFLDEFTFWSGTSLSTAQVNTLCCGTADCSGVCTYHARMDSHGISGLAVYFDIDGDTHPTATDEAGGDDNGTYTNTEAEDVSETLP